MRHHDRAMTRTQISFPDMRAGSRLPPPAAAARRRPRARLQLLLAGLWLLDGILQLQPYMFSRNFATQTLLPAAAGNPGWIATPVTWAATVIGNHPAPTNTLCALVELALGAGIACRRTRTVALACSGVWAAAVWYFGQGLGGLVTGQANPLNGAPGSAALYLLAAILLLPPREPGPPAFPAAGRIGEHAAKWVWSGFWLVLAYLTLLPVNRAPGAFSQAMAGGTITAGEPSWLTALAGRAAAEVNGDDLVVATVLTVLLALIAACVWAPNPGVRRAGLLATIVLAAVYWVFGEGLGMPFSQATDPNTGPLLALLAAAYWPRPRASQPAPAAAPAVVTTRRAGARVV
jgi:hypothetical protein